MIGFIPFSRVWFDGFAKKLSSLKLVHYGTGICIQHARLGFLVVPPRLLAGDPAICVPASRGND